MQSICSQNVASFTLKGRLVSSVHRHCAIYIYIYMVRCFSKSLPCTFKALERILVLGVEDFATYRGVIGNLSRWCGFKRFQNGQWQLMILGDTLPTFCLMFFISSFQISSSTIKVWKWNSWQNMPCTVMGIYPLSSSWNPSRQWYNL